LVHHLGVENPRQAGISWRLLPNWESWQIPSARGRFKLVILAGFVDKFTPSLSPFTPYSIGVLSDWNRALLEPIPADPKELLIAGSLM